MELVQVRIFILFVCFTSENNHSFFAFPQLFPFNVQSHSDSVVLLQAVFFCVLAIVFVFIACELCHRLETSFSEINVAICKLQWYSYPINIQRMLVPCLIYTQQPVVIAFFGSIAGNREQFKKASKIFPNFIIETRIRN